MYKIESIKIVESELSLELLRLYSTGHCPCFALSIKPNASEMYIQRK